ncbi:TetR/AcrR family transcriptional regulator [Streptomyces sp. FXJ1.172]|uniref:TetR/AcrR family transcriptional regulator n=1 Tax=Streptomyces sp. FXJ1.172 TaxID=710705 RepID=UPI0007CFF77F|nr:TetR/AcrR family transcriptional regulator [Streptomyces sp. FXJ1.172]WEO93166.1 TetR/AcrR family transcriptional regulator [Streptomyces sp. FXJ1.172]
MTQRVTKRRRETNERLLDAAEQAFAECGFQGVSIAELCARAGYTTGAFYSNYDSKDELFLALFTRRSEIVLKQLSEAVDQALVSEQPVATFIELASVVDEQTRTWFLISTEFTLHAIRNPEAAQALARHDAAIRAAIAELLAPLLATTQRQVTETDLDMLLRLVVAVREGGLAQSLVEPAALPHGELERRFLPALFGGLR